MNELKQELEIDVHRVSVNDNLVVNHYSCIFPGHILVQLHCTVQVSVDELCKRFNSNVGEGLTDDQVFILPILVPIIN